MMISLKVGWKKKRKREKVGEREKKVERGRKDNKKLMEGEGA